MEIIIIIILFCLVWNTGIGRFILGNMAKVCFSAIGAAVCMAIPIPILNVILAIVVVIKIWGSKIG